MRGSVVRGALAAAAVLGAVTAPALAAAAGESARAPARAADRLVAFSSCADLLGHVRARALPLVGPYGVTAYPGLSNIRFRAVPVIGDGPVPAPPPPTPSLTPEAPQEGIDFSGTNVQEAGVDEPDTVKTDGRRLFTIAGGKIHAVAVDGQAPRLAGTLDLSEISPAGLLLVGNRLLVLGSGPAVAPPPPDPVPLPGPIVDPVQPRPTPPPAPKPTPSRAAAREHLSIAPGLVRRSTVLAQIDVSNPAAMTVLATLSVDGGYVSARLTGDTARVVIASSPAGLPFTFPATGEESGAQAATAANRQIVARSGTAAWVPRFRLAKRGVQRAAEGRAVRCREVRHPKVFSGLGMITVLTVDAAGPLRIVDSDAVMSDGETVYASTSGLYVATARWFDQSVTPAPGAISRTRTLIHRFATASPTETSYRGSGSVPGFVLNQFSLSEHEGRLRVATTEQPDWIDQSQGQASESGVTVLEERAGALAQVGRVGGLGRGERIYAVRFLGTRGYVVTFRQTDPLYVLDLSDPGNPVVRGELKIPGFSSYLHPVGEDRLIGIGQDADEDGRVQGSQVSLFDVSDPASPRRLAQAPLGRGWSEAESDHHAFLYWPRTSLLVVPMASHDAQAPFIGAIGLRVGTGAIDEVGRVTHPASEEAGGRRPILRRSVVVRDALLTISDQGIRASALDTLADRSFLAFP